MAAGLFFMPTNIPTAIAAPVLGVAAGQKTSADTISVSDRRSVHITRKTSGGFATLFDSERRRNDEVLKATTQATLSIDGDIAGALEAYYSSPKARPIWVDRSGPNVRARSALQMLSKSEDWGLASSDYIVDTRFSSTDPQAMAQFEVALSGKFLMYLQDNYRGRIDPNKLSSYYDLKRKTIDLKATLSALANGVEPATLTAQVLPSDPKFSDLAAELQVLRKTKSRDGASGNMNKVIIAMEEMRWLPRELPARYVFVNQPAYMAYYYEGGRAALGMRAVIGQENHQTNVFAASIKTVEFNPTWGVPQSIIRNEMLPHLKRDPAYLDKQGYTVSVKGVSMPSSKVDWSQPLKNIGVVQPPGPENALGRLKILFPNSHLIYMHDTPARGRFASQDLMFSHGCIRLENPRGMAAAVMKTSVESIDRQIALGAKVDVPVPEEVPVFISYFTAWPSDDGVVHFYDDVYGRDPVILDAIQRTSLARARS